MAETAEPLSPWHHVSFCLGVLLVVLSFSNYGLYPVVAFLRISALSKGKVVLALWASSWALFLFGSYLIGTKGAVYLKSLWVKLKNRV